MKRSLRYLILVLLMGAGKLASAQTAGIHGTVMDKHNLSVISASVVVREGGENGIQKGGVATNIDGYYDITPLTPGLYTVTVSYLGNTEVVNNVRVSSGTPTTVNVVIGTSKTLPEFKKVEYKVPLVSIEHPLSVNTKTAEQISHLAIVNVNAIASLSTGVYQNNNRGSLSIGGARTSGTKYIVDGVQLPPGDQSGVNIAPSAIEEVQTITGGVPAKYGDASGGVINITTKGSTPRTTGSVNLEQSLDGYNNKYGYFHLSGPLLKRKDSAGVKHPVLGYELHGTMTYNKDGSPYYTPTYILKPGVLADLQANPFLLVADQTGQIQTIDRASLITANELTSQKQKVNDLAYGPQVGGKLDYQLNDNISVLFGGQYGYSNGKNFSRYSTIFAPDMNSESVGNTTRAYLRFTQKFGNGRSGVGISNAYYTVQADYNRETGETYDSKLKENAFLYGYKGKFIQNYTQTATPGQDSLSNVFMVKSYDAPTGYTFIPSDVNPVSANYTKQYLDLVHGLYGQYYPGLTISSNTTQAQFLNGGFANGVNNLLTNITGGTTGYNKSVSTNYSVTADASFSLNTKSGIRNAIEFGLYFQQTNLSSYQVSGAGLWSLMRQLEEQVVNASTFNSVGTYKINGQTYTAAQVASGAVTPGPLDTVFYDHAFNSALQGEFDKNLRTKLFNDPNNTSVINIDALDPSTFSLNMFSADELLNGGKSLVSYYGYDYTGKKLTGQVNFDDFFTKTDANGNYTRPIAAIRPNYIAGYLSDFITFKDFNITLGVRAERYDANTKVLKDPYSLYAEQTAGMVSGSKNIINGGNHPSNIGSDYVVYVSDQTSGSIIGYRNGDTWYDANGRVVEDPKTLKTQEGNTSTSSDPQVYKQNADDNIRTPGFQSNTSFTDYKPVVSVMPRLNFSFPIVPNKSFFYAHYDVIVQRPTTGYIATPLSYYYLDQSGSIGNPDLKPEKNIDYEVGFQQVVTDNSSIGLGAYYHERLDQIQQRAYLYADPITYYTYGNRDYSSTKGFKLSYDFRRTPSSPLEMQINYTLSFVEGTGSDENSTGGGQLASFIAAGLPNLRNVYALDYDSRHSINVVLDYRYDRGEGPRIGGHAIFAGAGANLTFRARSGEPYTRYLFPQALGGLVTSSNTIAGGINDSRLPWHFGLDLKIDKDFTIGSKHAKVKSIADMNRTGGLHFNAYLRIENLLNIQDILSVYKYTGSAKDDGFLSSEVGQNYVNNPTNVSTIQKQAFTDLYYILMQEPGMFNVPRRVTLGVSMAF